MPVESSTVGVPSGYEAVITGYTADDFHSRCRWSNLDWDRRLSDFSEASVDCNFEDLFNGNDRAKTWSHGLRIERVRTGTEQSKLAWWGPLRSIDIDPNTGKVSLGAVDAAGLTSRRPLDDVPDADGEIDVILNNVDVATAFGRLILEAGDLRGLEPPAFATGVLTTRSYKVADFEMISAMLAELKELVRWSVVADELTAVGIEGVAGSSHLSGGGFYPTFGVFGAKAFAEMPGIKEDGDEQANDIIIPGADNGEQGFRQNWRATVTDETTGRLTRVVPSTFFRPTSDTSTNWDQFFSSMAAQMVSRWATAPTVISGGALSADAPVRINEMIPGTAWAIELEIGRRPVLSAIYLLDSVEVTVAKDEQGALAETIRPTLVPLSTVGLAI